MCGKNGWHLFFVTKVQDLFYLLVCFAFVHDLLINLIDIVH